MASFASGQITPTSDPIAESAAPYGGPLLSPGLISSGLLAPGTPPPPAATVCAAGSPCVLTGQYNRYRSSVNLAETTLGGMTDFTYFAPLNFFKLDAADMPSGQTYNPVMAQPLYLTGVTILSVVYNVLLVATLNDTVYAFDADTGTRLWKRTGSTALYQNCGGLTPQPFTKIDSLGKPGVLTLPYYGIVSTPVVDIVPTTPVMYVVSACATGPTATTYSWYMNAIDVTTGNDMTALPVPIGASTFFTPSYQIQRPSLLLNHVNDGGGHISTYVYAGFGTGVAELAGGLYTYHGAVFGYSVVYSPFSITALTGGPFTTSSSTLTTSIFPANASPPSCTGAHCYYGDNWIGNGGGLWQSGKGLAADGSANVFFGSGNGPFDCNSTGVGQTSCTDATNVLSWGQSVVKLPAPTSNALGSPSDFFTPNRYTFRNESGSTKAAYQFEELNRYDLDFGTPGVVLFQKVISGTQTNVYAITADKTGFVYSLPANNGFGLGQFRAGDVGVTSGTSQTQLPFQATDYPPPIGSTTVCPSRLDSLHFNDIPSDQINELAFWNDLLFVWPWNETARIFQGTLSNAGSTYTYSFGTTPAFPTTGTFGSTAGYPGGIMAIAANAGRSATLWTALTPSGSNDETLHFNGKLFAYTVQTSPVGLTYKWDSSVAANAACRAPPVSVSTWKVSPFAEPTLANGKVYLPVFNAASGSSTVSGILVSVPAPTN